MQGPKKKSAAKPKKEVPAKKAEKGPRPQRLPGLEDPKIEALEAKALDYAEVRDQRMALSSQEIELKKDLLDLMKAQKKEHYKRGTIEINIVHESENIKVKVKKKSDDDDDEAGE